MCGRGRVCLSVQQIKKAGNVVDSAIDADNLRSINNFSPGMASPVVISRESDKTREVQQMTFGLIPHFTSPKDKPNHYIMFNARIESVTEKPSFKTLLSRGKRCVVLFNGFYEWKTENKNKQPHYVYLQREADYQNKEGNVIESKNDKSCVLEERNSKRTESDESDSTVMKIAGLYDDWTDSDGKSKRTYTTLTCASCSGFQWLHTRQPVFLTDDLVDEWLDNKCDMPKLLKVLDSVLYKESYSSIIEAYPVTKKMGIASYQELDCNERVQSSFQTKNTVPKGISNFFKCSANSVNPIESENNLVPTISAATSSSSMKLEVLHDEGVVSDEEIEVVLDVREKNEERTGRTVENTENEIEKIIKYKEEEKPYIRSRQSDHINENIGSKADGGSYDDFKIISNDNYDLSSNINKNKRGNNDVEKDDIEVEVEVVKSSSNASTIPPSSSSSSSSSRDCAVSESVLSSCHCPICNLNISSLSESKRTFHVNGCCIDSSASTSTQRNVSTPKKQSKTSSHEKSKPSDGKKVNLKSEEGRGEGMKKGRIDNYFYASPT